jgi:hypothetical protein
VNAGGRALEGGRRAYAVLNNDAVLERGILGISRDLDADASRGRRGPKLLFYDAPERSGRGRAVSAALPFSGIAASTEDRAPWIYTARSITSPAPRC